jgi:hypothetical protein
MIEKVLMLMLDQIVENDIQHNDEQQLSLLKVNIEKKFLTKRKLFIHKRRHCLKIPPLGIFFSCSSSTKLEEYARINKSAKLITRFNIFSALNGDKPSVFSKISISC